MAVSRPRVLVVAPRYPYPPWRGDQVRVFQLVAALSARADVRIVCFGQGEPLPVAGVGVRTVSSRTLPRIAANLRAGLAVPLQVRLFLDTEMARAVREEIDAWNPDVVHVTLARMAPYLPPPGPWRRHLDLVDSLSLNMETRARAHRGPIRGAFRLEAGLMRRYEAREAARADTCSVVSEADRAMPGLEGAAVIPNGVDPNGVPFAAPVERPPAMIFFGNLGYFHNAEPARFLAENVLPLVRRTVPSAVLRLVGARPRASVRRLADLDGVELLADVPEMAPHLHDGALAALPSFSGSGIKNKVLEAFCAGLPVVANGLGVQGVEGAVPGRHFERAESAAEIAAAAVALMADADRRCAVAEAAHQLILERYTWQRQAERLLDLYGVPDR